MERVQKIKAFLNLDDAKTEIGTMVENQGKIYFKYHPNEIDKQQFKILIKKPLILRKGVS